MAVWAVILLVVLILALAGWTWNRMATARGEQCPACGSAFETPEELDRHLSSHGEVKRPTLTP
jgi:hypothetical protein